MTAAARRHTTVRAAMTEFAHGGYNGTSTEAIARRVGVSQPYLFRLFPNKQALFFAAAEHCMTSMREMFVDAAKDVPQEDRLEAMGRAYRYMIDAEPEWLLMQMQIFAAVAAAEAAGDREFGASVRRVWQDLWDTVHLELGADIDLTTQFMAYGMLINSLVSLGFPPQHRNWGGFHMAGLEADRPAEPTAEPLTDPTDPPTV